MNSNRSKGFTLVELMVAMVVGLIIVTGAFSLHSTTRKTQLVNEAQMDMSADARFAIEMIAYDLRHAGMWGNTNLGGQIDCRATDPGCVTTAAGDTPPTTAINDCSVGWFISLMIPVFATDNTVGNPYSLTCIPVSEGYVAGTDILDIRYADSNLPVPPLASDLTFVRSNFENGRLFVGSQPPELIANETNPSTDNFVLHAYSYYVSNHTDAAGDGIPSLRRASLSNGPEVKNQTLISGVVDLQVQFGVDLAGDDEIVDAYVNPNVVGTITDGWQKVFSVKVWLVMRSEFAQKGLDSVTTFSIAGGDVSYPSVGTDGFRYFMVSSVVNLRNRKTS